MAGFMELFKWGGSVGPKDTIEIGKLFPLSVTEVTFIETEVRAIYVKILTDVAERTQGLDSDQEELLWDNCLASESSMGLISLLAEAMYHKSDLFLVVDPATNVLRKATQQEQQQIKADYAARAESKTGVYISFKNYARTDMIKLYSALDYATVGGLNKMLHLSKAVQIKINELRSSVGLVDAELAKNQAQAIADSLKKGQDIYLDAKDILETANPNLDPTTAAMNLLNQKRAFYLNMPASYITGELNSGLGDTGQADARARERGLKGFFVSIFKPVCKSLFNKDVTFKSEDFAQITSSLEVLKTFELVSEELISAENKLLIINRLFGFDDDEEGGAPDPAPEPAQLPPGPGVPGAEDDEE